MPSKVEVLRDQLVDWTRSGPHFLYLFNFFYHNFCCPFSEEDPQAGLLKVMAHFENHK